MACCRATLHADEPSPHVDWSAGAVRLLTEPVPWPAGGRPRRAGVSSFGFSGTNAHVIVAEAPPAATQRFRRRWPGAGGAGREGRLAWLVSARTAEGLAAQAGRLAACVAARPELDPADVGWSLATTRSVFEHRAVVIGGGPGGAGGGAGGGGGRGARGRGGDRGGAGGRRGPGGVRVPRAGRPVGGDGRGAGRVLPGVRGAAGRVRRGAGPARGLGPAARCWPGRTGRRRWTGWTWCSRRCGR